jgi:membrane protease YdiL (CAAX protease family)
VSSTDPNQQDGDTAATVTGHAVDPRAQRIRRVIADHPVAIMLAAMFAVGYTVLIPAALADLPLEPFLLVAILFGQLLPAVLITAAEGGRPAVRALFGRVFRWRVPFRWYLAALLLIPLSCLAVSGIYGPENWRALVTDPGVILGYLNGLSILPVVNLWEETAWTGVIQARLAHRHGPLMAAVLTGPLFGLLHLPLRIGEPAGTFALGLAFTMILAIGLRIVIGWLYYSTGASILIAAVVHATFNATNNGELLTRADPGSPLLDDLAFYVVAVLGLLIAVLTRGRLGAPADGSFPDAPNRGATRRHRRR